MLRNKRFKYLMPLAVGTLLIVVALPVHASPSHQISDAYSIVNNGFSVQWDGTPTNDNVDIDSGDIVYWNARWKHNDAYYTGNYYLGYEKYGLSQENIDIGVYIGQYGVHERTNSAQLYLDSDPSKNYLSRIHDYAKHSDVFNGIFGRTSYGIISLFG